MLFKLKRSKNKYRTLFETIKDGLVQIDLEGKIINAKTAFSTVSKVTAAINKGKKVSAKGIRGTIGRAVKRILK